MGLLGLLLDPGVHKILFVPSKSLFPQACVNCGGSIVGLMVTSSKRKSVLISSSKEISPEYSLEELMLKPKLQYFGHLMWWTDSFEKTLMLWKIEGGRRRGQQRMRWLDGMADSVDIFEQAPGVGNGQGSLMCCSPWGCKQLDMTEWLNWIVPNLYPWLPTNCRWGCL